MKLVRYGNAGAERPGFIDSKGSLRDLSSVVADLTGDVLHPDQLHKLTSLTESNLPLVDGNPRLGCPVAQVGKFIGIGLNYFDHAEETGAKIPDEPIIFMKANSSVSGPNDDIILPRDSKKTDWEVELGIVIGKTARYVSKDDALSHVAGYVIVNDVSERSYQLERGGSWDKGKGCDTFGPIGPWLVTSDAVPDPQALSMWLDVNGQPRQRGSTASMIFDCATLVAYVSSFMTLEPGDVIATGTPAGVGLGMKPEPQFLKEGDVVTLGIDGLGSQRQVVKAMTS